MVVLQLRDRLLVETSLDGLFDGSKEWLQHSNQFVVCNGQIPFEQPNELPLRQVNVCVGHKSVGVLCPVLVQWTGVIERLGTQYESRKENAVSCCFHSHSISWQNISQPVEINQRCHQRWGLYIQVADQCVNEFSQ